MTDPRPPVTRHASVGKLEPEGEYCLTLDQHHLIIMRHASQEVVQHTADLINNDYTALLAEQARLEAQFDEQFNRANEWRELAEVQRLRAEQLEAQLAQVEAIIKAATTSLDLLRGNTRSNP